MNVLALCAGIGGLELGIEEAGIEVENCTYVKRDPYAAAVLAARVESGDLAPGRVVVGDLAALSVSRGEYDLVTAGFPCQPASAAGKRLGRSDDRWIWPLIADLIAKCEPAQVFLENVRGLLTVDGGAAFRSVLESLLACGLSPRWDLVSAAQVGAPHRRERIFLLADRRDMGPERVPDALCNALRHELERGQRAAREADSGDAEPRHLGEGLADAGVGLLPLAGRGPEGRAGARPAGSCVDDASGYRRERDQARAEGAREVLEQADHAGAVRHLGWPPGPRDVEGWRRWLAAGGPAPAVEGRLNADFVEALMGFPRGWTDLGAGDAARRERLRCLGNAVVPAQAALAYHALS